MRSNIHAPRLRALSSASALVVLVGLMSACSNDASRLDEMLTSSVQMTDNQSAIINRRAAANQAYPGDIQETSERSGIAVAKTITNPPSTVYHPAPLAPAVARSSLPTVTTPIANRSISGIETASRPPVYSAPKVTPPVVQTPTVNGPIVLQPRQTDANPLKIVGMDDVVTGSVSPKQQQLQQPQVQTTKPVGWNNTTGARVTIRQGETLHNLSRRYGVPVAAIMKANDIKDADSVQAGQKVLIPAYNYAETAPVSAPDNDPITNVSRASRGFQGQPRGRVAVPTMRTPNQPVTPAPVTPVARTMPATNGSSYVVQSGDTLSAIARKTGSSTSAIRTANNLNGDVVRLGQTLIIPGAGYDQTVTGSVPPDGQSGNSNADGRVASEPVTLAKRAEEKVDTPVKTSSSGFRWPAEGRIISKFGERQASGSNDGIDISVPIGTPVKASENGTVIYSGAELEDFGKLILVSHEGGWVSAYAHASATLVRRGDKVTRGQVIAKSGNSGNATVPKLHFELRKNSTPVNPLQHLQR